MIETLTAEQLARIPDIVEKYVGIGLKTGNINREAAKAYSKKLYSFLGREEPIVIFLDGPIHAWMAVEMLSLVYDDSQVVEQIVEQVRSQVREQVCSQVREQVASQVTEQVYSQVGSQIQSQVGSQVWSQVTEQVYSQVSEQVASQVSSQVYSQVGLQVRSQVRE